MRQSVVVATVLIELGEVMNETHLTKDEVFKSLNLIDMKEMDLKLVPTHHVLFDENHQPVRAMDLADGLVTFERYQKQRSL